MQICTLVKTQQKKGKGKKRVFVYVRIEDVVICINGAVCMVFYETDSEAVKKLEKDCVSNKNVSIFCEMMGDPLCRIRFYPVRVMLVAEMGELGELLGVVRGCIKEVGYGLRTSHLKMGFVLGLRVSPMHRQMGIGLNLMKAIEEWLARNGAEYVYLATEENNLASRNLFTRKCDYKVLIPLQIYVLSIDKPVKKPNWNINIEKLQVNQAVSFYKKQLKCKDLYPDDIETILRGRPSLGTWVCYFNNEDREGLFLKNHNTETTKPSSWIVFSLWNSREVYKLQTRRSSPFHYLLYAALSRARELLLPCIKLPSVCGSLQKPLGFIFMYGLFGEGKRLRELMNAAWNFAAKSANDVGCKLVMTEVGESDPLKKHISPGSSVLCINDLWYFKDIDNLGVNIEEKSMVLSGSLANVFVDPRDF